MSMLLRNLLVLAVEFGAALLLRAPDAPWIPVLLAVFVVGSGVLHGTDAEFTPRFLVALIAVGVAELGSRAWASPDAFQAAGTGAAILLAVQTLILVRYSLRRPGRRPA
ncbi:hypothetical protein K7B10_28895 [Streptomyces flavotricini]|uniref:Integral membrane protein n=1 Tax=Streptomyces flavotricini TaxID=66888 RepID=A0ABS8ECT7_9ACTN|nr:hypothetical protein [Streptomyces flavotricini]MCC0098719.1 hypothetical protein [Streptomyces flavotricini]